MIINPDDWSRRKFPHYWSSLPGIPVGIMMSPQDRFRPRVRQSHLPTSLALHHSIPHVNILASWSWFNHFLRKKPLFEAASYSTWFVYLLTSMSSSSGIFPHGLLAGYLTLPGWVGWGRFHDPGSHEPDLWLQLVETDSNGWVYSCMGHWKVEFSVKKSATSVLSSFKYEEIWKRDLFCNIIIIIIIRHEM